MINYIQLKFKDVKTYISLYYDKARLLNKQFISVFTIDNGIILSQLSNSYTIPPDKIPYLYL